MVLIDGSRRDTSSVLTGESLIRIEVRFYAFLREITGKHSESIILEGGSTIIDALKLIIDKYGERMRRCILDDEGQIRKSITIAINAQKIDRARIEGYELNDGDVLVIIPPTAGGALLI
jgi:MoaD family protein